jgi:hypothetical protein
MSADCVLCWLVTYNLKGNLKVQNRYQLTTCQVVNNNWEYRASICFSFLGQMILCFVIHNFRLKMFFVSFYYVWFYCYIKVFSYTVLKTGYHWNPLPFFWSLVHWACLFPTLSVGSSACRNLSSFWQVLGPKVILELSSKLHCYQVPQVLVSICLFSAYKRRAV